MPQAALNRLAALLPAERWLAQPEQLAAYESDGLTAFRSRPLGVAIPETADEVIALVRHCHQERLPFVARRALLKVSGSSTRPSESGLRKLDGAMKFAGSTPTISTGLDSGPP